LKELIYKLAIIIVILFVEFVPATKVIADVAPPNTLPGSNINTVMQTKVQMISENVILEIANAEERRYKIVVDVDFYMLNRSEVAEELMVRFPLEDILGRDDGYGRFPKIENLEVQNNRRIIETKIEKQPYKNGGIPINWATFKILFPSNKPVVIHVKYYVDLQNYYKSEINYLIGTGSGWYGSIEHIFITYRLLYSVNLFNTDLNNVKADLMGNDIHMQWQNYEPKYDEIVGLTIVHPEIWKKILSHEELYKNDPYDSQIAIELSKDYEEIGSDKHGCIENQSDAEVSERIIEESLVKSPEEISLLQRLSEIKDWGSGCEFQKEENNFQYICIGTIAVMIIIGIGIGIFVILRENKRKK
jgi:hypothetical protein